MGTITQINPTAEAAIAQAEDTLPQKDDQFIHWWGASRTTPSSCSTRRETSELERRGRAAQGLTAPRDHRPALLPLLTEEALASGWPAYELQQAADGRFEDEGWRVRKDGTRFWANVVITALRDESGTLGASAKITRDLTERKHAEDKTAAERGAVPPAGEGVQRLRHLHARPRRATSSPGTPGPSASRATARARSSASTSPASTRPRTWRRGKLASAS